MTNTLNLNTLAYAKRKLPPAIQHQGEVRSIKLPDRTQQLNSYSGSSNPLAGLAIDATFNTKTMMFKSVQYQAAITDFIWEWELVLE